MNLFKIGFTVLFFQILILIIEPFLHPLQVLYALIINFLLNLPINDNVIYVNNFILEIGPLCTGVLTYFTLCSLFFAFFDFKVAFKWSLLIFPIMFLLNFIRIFLTCLFTKYFGSFGIFFHNVYWIFDTISVFIIFIFIHNYINKKN